MEPVLKCELYKLFFLQFACVWSFTSGTVLYRNTYIVMPFENKNSLDRNKKKQLWWFLTLHYCRWLQILYGDRFPASVNSTHIITDIYGCRPGFPACSCSAGECWRRPSGEQRDGWLDAVAAVRARILQAWMSPHKNVPKSADWGCHPRFWTKDRAE